MISPDVRNMSAAVGGDFTVLMNPYNGRDALHSTFKSGAGLPLEIGGHVDLQNARDIVKRTKDGGLKPLCPDGMQRNWASCMLFMPYNNFYEVRTNGKYNCVPINDKKASKKLNIDDSKISVLLDGISISNNT